MLGLRFCARAFSSWGKRGPLFIAVRRPLTVAASPVAEHRLQTRRLSSCGSRAQLLRGMWDPPRPGLEPVSPALAGRLSTTAPPGKPTVPDFCPHFIDQDPEVQRSCDVPEATEPWTLMPPDLTASTPFFSSPTWEAEPLCRRCCPHSSKPSSKCISSHDVFSPALIHQPANLANSQRGRSPFI